MAYDHTQTGRFHWLLGLLALGAAAATPEARLAGLAGTLLFGLLGASFATLRVRDAGQGLELRFGPVPLLRRTVAYTEIESVREGRSRLVDGWGIHWVPWRGRTWNLWGFECVELGLSRGRKLRIGTDDAANLAAFLRGRVRGR